MYWAYAGRTNNNNKISPSRNAHNPRFCRIRRGYEIEFSLTRHPSLGGAGTGEGPLKAPNPGRPPRTPHQPVLRSKGGRHLVKRRFPNLLSSPLLQSKALAMGTGGPVPLVASCSSYVATTTLLLAK
jgi:hypothetical protein